MISYKDNIHLEHIGYVLNDGEISRYSSITVNNKCIELFGIEFRENKYFLFMAPHFFDNGDCIDAWKEIPYDSKEDLQKGIIDNYKEYLWNAGIIANNITISEGELIRG